MNVFESFTIAVLHPRHLSLDEGGTWVMRRLQGISLVRSVEGLALLFAHGIVLLH